MTCGSLCPVSKFCAVLVVLAMVSVVTIVTLWTVALSGAGAEDVTAPWDRFRLPSSLVPRSYDITLWPRLSPAPDSGRFLFTGRSSVEFDCVSDTDLVLVHSTRLDLSTGPRLTAADGGAVPGIKSWRLHPKTQFLVLHLEGPLRRGHRYQLHSEFSGELADDLAGFYRSQYVEGGVTKVVATSQMHPTHARKTFPCFDEPAMKAVFNITILHPPGTVALSNGRETEVVNRTVDGEVVTQTRFEPTKKMSTYLLAVIVCDFANVSTTQGPTLIQIWARRTAIQLGQGDYALQVTGPVLQFFQSYYNISYPLSKSDQIALPDFYFGAMENWGLVTYREANLLYDPLTSSSRNKETTATIIAHELAHMWFGNLVTLRWWNEVWLNEGFATYVSYLGADHAEPTWNVKDLIVLDDVHRSFAIDALTSSHPLSSKEDDVVLPEQIMAQFDAISYSKGASVLRMLSDFLSEPVFVQGLSSYLSHFAYSNTEGTDLWNHLEMAVKANNVSLPVPVEDVMKPWVLQMGFPVVTVDTSTGNVSQSHFLLDPESNVTVQSPYKYQWLVPVRWMKSGDTESSIWWLLRSSDVNLGMRSGGSWLLANVNVTGYFRVNYDLGNWERLLVQLQAQHQVIPPLNRAQLIDDAFNLARAELVSTSLALRTTVYLQGETEYVPWQSALNNLDYYELMLDRTEVYGPMKSYMKNLVTPLFFYFGETTSNWTDVPGTLTDQYNQVNALQVACRSGVPECRCLTAAWFRLWTEDPGRNPIGANLRAAAYCSAVEGGGEAEWDFVWSQFKDATSAGEAEKLMAALACSAHPHLLQRLLSYTLDPEKIRKQDATAAITAVARNRAGQEPAWDFVRRNWNFMFTQYGVGSFSFSSIIAGVTRRFSTEAELQQLKDFVRENADFGSASAAVEQALETTAANIKWVETNRREVLDWFVAQTAARTGPQLVLSATDLSLG